MIDTKTWAVILIVAGVVANNLVYLQDLWFGQPVISLDSWRAYGALAVSWGLVVVGLVLLLRTRGTSGQ